MTDWPMTTTELREKYNISKTLAGDWFDALEDAGLARRAPGRPWGTKLYSQEAAEFLLSRQGKFGVPPWWSRESHLAEWEKS